MSTILALGGGGAAGHVADWSALLADEASTRGHRLIVVDRAENLVNAAIAKDTRHNVVAADFADADAVRAALKGQPAPDAVVGFREFSLQAAAEIAAEIGSAWNGPTEVATCRAKDRAHVALRAAGLPQPEFASFENTAAATEHIRARPLPVIVKPRDAFGSQAVRLIESVADIAPAIRDAFGYSDIILVEEFVHGQEFSVEGIFVDGDPHILDITEKQTTPPPVFVELGHRQPCRPPEPVQVAVRQTALQAVRAVGLTHSLFHLDD